MKTLIVGSDSQRIAFNQCHSWAECYEWAEQYCGWFGLKRLSSHRANGQLIVWVEVNNV